MQVFVLEREQIINRPIEQVFDFFGDARNLEAITPHWLGFRIMTPSPITMQLGTRIEYRLLWRFVRFGWTTEISAWEPPFRFIDEQSHGPYESWRHTHIFETVPEGTRIRDVVRYSLPMGPVGRMAHRLLVARDLATIFDFRARRVRELLQGSAEFRPPKTSEMRPSET